jgi:hypothetical protein
MKKAKEIWTDYQGNQVPVQYVSKYDKQKEKVITKAVLEAQKISETLAKFKLFILPECDNLLKEMLASNGVDEVTQKNYTLYSFDKGLKVEVVSSDVIDFDNQIVAAQAKIEEYLKIKTDGLDNEICALINNAFKTRKGRLDKARILGLFQLKITHHLWMEAMELIKKSITTNSTRRYITIFERDAEGKYNQIQLNFSAI